MSHDIVIGIHRDPTQPIVYSGLDKEDTTDDSPYLQSYLINGGGGGIGPGENHQPSAAASSNPPSLHRPLTSNHYPMSNSAAVDALLAPSPVPTFKRPQGANNVSTTGMSSVSDGIACRSDPSSADLGGPMESTSGRIVDNPTQGILIGVYELSIDTTRLEVHKAQELFNSIAFSHFYQRICQNTTNFHSEFEHFSRLFYDNDEDAKMAAAAGGLGASGCATAPGGSACSSANVSQRRASGATSPPNVGGAPNTASAGTAPASGTPVRKGLLGVSTDSETGPLGGITNTASSSLSHVIVNNNSVTNIAASSNQPVPPANMPTSTNSNNTSAYNSTNTANGRLNSPLFDSVYSLTDTIDTIEEEVDTDSEDAAIAQLTTSNTFVNSSSMYNINNVVGTTTTTGTTAATITGTSNGIINNNATSLSRLRLNSTSDPRSGKLNGTSMYLKNPHNNSSLYNLHTPTPNINNNDKADRIIVSKDKIDRKMENKRIENATALLRKYFHGCLHLIQQVIDGQYKRLEKILLSSSDKRVFTVELKSVVQPSDYYSGNKRDFPIEYSDGSRDRKPSIFIPVGTTLICVYLRNDDNIKANDLLRPVDWDDLEQKVLKLLRIPCANDLTSGSSTSTAGNFVLLKRGKFRPALRTHRTYLLQAGSSDQLAAAVAAAAATAASEGRNSVELHPHSNIPNNRFGGFISTSPTGKVQTGLITQPGKGHKLYIPQKAEIIDRFTYEIRRRTWIDMVIRCIRECSNDECDDNSTSMNVISKHHQPHQHPRFKFMVSIVNMSTNVGDFPIDNIYKKVLRLFYKRNANQLTECKIDDALRFIVPQIQSACGLRLTGFSDAPGNGDEFFDRCLEHWKSKRDAEAEIRYYNAIRKNFVIAVPVFSTVPSCEDPLPLPTILGTCRGSKLPSGPFNSEVEKEMFQRYKGFRSGFFRCQVRHPEQVAASAAHSIASPTTATIAGSSSSEQDKSPKASNNKPKHVHYHSHHHSHHHNHQIHHDFCAEKFNLEITSSEELCAGRSFIGDAVSNIVACFCVSKDGKYLASVTVRGVVVVENLASMHRDRIAPLETYRRPTAIAIHSPAYDVEIVRLAVGYSDGDVLLFKVDHNKEAIVYLRRAIYVIAQEKLSPNLINTLIFYDKKNLVIGLDNGELIAWKPDRDGEEGRKTFICDDSRLGDDLPDDDACSDKQGITCIDACRAAGMIAVGNYNGSVALWLVDDHSERNNHFCTNSKLFDLKPHRTAVTAVSFSTSGSVLYVGGFDGRIVIWDTIMGMQLRTIFQAYKIPRKLFHPREGNPADRSWVACERCFEETVETHHQPVRSLSISQDGSLLTAVFQSGHVIFLDAHVRGMTYTDEDLRPQYLEDPKHAAPTTAPLMLPAQTGEQSNDTSGRNSPVSSTNATVGSIKRPEMKQLKKYQSSFRFESIKKIDSESDSIGNCDSNNSCSAYDKSKDSRIKDIVMINGKCLIGRRGCIQLLDLERGQETDLYKMSLSGDIDFKANASVGLMASEDGKTILAVFSDHVCPLTFTETGTIAPLMICDDSNGEDCNEMISSATSNAFTFTGAGIINPTTTTTSDSNKIPSPLPHEHHHGVGQGLLPCVEQRCRRCQTVIRGYDLEQCYGKVMALAWSHCRCLEPQEGDSVVLYCPPSLALSTSPSRVQSQSHSQNGQILSPRSLKKLKSDDVVDDCSTITPPFLHAPLTQSPNGFASLSPNVHSNSISSSISSSSSNRFWKVVPGWFDDHETEYWKLKPELGKISAISIAMSVDYHGNTISSNSPSNRNHLIHHGLQVLVGATSGAVFLITKQDNDNQLENEKPLYKHLTAVNTVHLEGKFIFTGSYDRYVHIYDNDKKSLIQSLKHEHEVICLTSCPKTSVLMVGCKADTIVLWYWRTGDKLKEIIPPNSRPAHQVSAVAYSNCEQLLITTTSDRQRVQFHMNSMTDDFHRLHTYAALKRRGYNNNFSRLPVNSRMILRFLENASTEEVKDFCGKNPREIREFLLLHIGHLLPKEKLEKMSLSEQRVRNVALILSIMHNYNKIKDKLKPIFQTLPHAVVLTISKYGDLMDTMLALQQYKHVQITKSSIVDLLSFYSFLLGSSPKDVGLDIDEEYWSSSCRKAFGPYTDESKGISKHMLNLDPFSEKIDINKVIHLCESDLLLFANFVKTLKPTKNYEIMRSPFSRRRTRIDLSLNYLFRGSEDRVKANFWSENGPGHSTSCDVVVPYFIPLRNIARLDSKFLKQVIQYAEDYGDLSIFANPVVRLLIEFKWESFARKRFRIDFCILGFWNICIIINALLMRAYTLDHDTNYDGIITAMLVLRLAIVVLLVRFLLRELLELVGNIQGEIDDRSARYKLRNFFDYAKATLSGFRAYLLSFSNIIDISVYTGIIIALLYQTAALRHENYSQYTNASFAIMMPFLGMNILSDMAVEERFGSYIAMMVVMLKSSISILILFGVMVVSFSAGFMLAGVDNGSFDRFDVALLTVYSYLFGGISYKDMLGAETAKIAVALFIIFRFIISIVLFNLLIGIMAFSQSKLNDRGAEAVLLAKATYIVTYESVTFRWNREEMDTSHDRKVHNGLNPISVKEAMSGDELKQRKQPKRSSRFGSMFMMMDSDHHGTAKTYRPAMPTSNSGMIAEDELELFTATEEREVPQQTEIDAVKMNGILKEMNLNADRSRSTNMRRFERALSKHWDASVNNKWFDYKSWYRLFMDVLLFALFTGAIVDRETEKKQFPEYIQILAKDGVDLSTSTNEVKVDNN